MLKRMLILLVNFFFISLLFLQVESKAQDNDEISIDLFLARGSLAKAEYERYKLSNNVLWRECGEIETEEDTKMPEIGETVSSQTKLAVKDKGIVKVDISNLTYLNTSLTELLNKLPETEANPLEKDSAFSMFGPGIAELYITVGSKSKEIILPLDDLTSNKTSTPKGLLVFIQMMRGFGPVICGSKSFYGIDRLSLE